MTYQLFLKLTSRSKMKTTIKYMGNKENFALNVDYIKCKFDEMNMAVVDEESAIRLVRENPNGFRIVGVSVEDDPVVPLVDNNVVNDYVMSNFKKQLENPLEPPLPTSTKTYKTVGTANMAISKREGMSRDTHEAKQTDDGFIIVPIADEDNE